MKLTLNAHLLWSLSHCTHALFDIEARMARSSNHTDHALNACPTIQADVTNSIDMTQVTNCTREKRVARY